MDKARETALKILYDIEKNKSYSNIAVKNMLKNINLSDTDRHFVTSLVYGVIDKRLTLDYVISSYSKLKLKKISLYILLILRMGIYQIMFMDKIPDNAAVDEAVKLAKRYGHSASSGFVNGILRNVIRNGITYPEDKREYLSVKYSYPLWLTDMWINDFGYEFCEQLMIAFSENARLTLRANALKTTVKDLAKELNVEIYDMDDIAVECEGFEISNNKLYNEGYFSVQDKAAQAVSKILEPREGDIVIDMCAAPGGKTTHIAEIMGNKGEIFAFDKYSHKTDLIDKNAKRLGIDIIKTNVCDATKLNDDLVGVADRVLCDVPCSGLGIIKRKPEIKWKDEEDFSELYKIQAQILKNGAQYLKENGIIVYSTCTVNPRENGAITEAFLNTNPCFKKVYEKTYYPHTDKTDGFYVCKMQRCHR